MIGEQLGSYRITARLGAGGMGEVWLGAHALLGSSAAIKVLRAGCCESQRIVQRFFDEARAATRIDHPSIVTVYDFGWHQGRAYLVMELLRGETLAQAIEHGPIEPGRALGLLRQCAVAMAAAHGVGIVHRDLKPDNIYLVPDPLAGERVKVLDFGIAKLMGDDHEGHARTQTGMIMGTPAYMSPEQCRGAGGVDHRTDVYALGCVLFHLLTGRPPFTGETPGDLIASHLTVAPPLVGALVPACAGPVEALTARCLAKDVAQRIGSMLELIDAIDAIFAAPPVPRPRAGVALAALASVPGTATTMGSSAGQSLDVPPVQRRAGFYALVVVIALAVTAVIVVATRPGDEREGGALPAAGTSGAPDAAGTSGALDAAGTSGALDAAGTSGPPAVANHAGSAIDAGALDASASPPIDSGNVTPLRRPPSRKGSATPPAGTGSGGSAYDPYDDR